MKLTIESLNILLLLLPGFLSGQIFYSVFKLGNISAPKRVLDALLFSFLTYLFVSVVTTWKPLAQVASSGQSLDYTFSGDTKLILCTLVTIVCIPIAIGFAYYSDHVHWILRKLKITTKTSRDNTWNDVFLTQNRYVIITLKDERRIRGYPTMFSNDPEEGFIYLYNPAWVNDDKNNDSEPDYYESNCHGFLINRENINLVEFTLEPKEKLSQMS